LDFEGSGARKWFGCKVVGIIGQRFLWSELLGKNEKVNILQFTVFGSEEVVVE
jgi:hypothetical protein